MTTTTTTPAPISSPAIPPCAHAQFQSHVHVDRNLEEKTFVVELALICVECGTPFLFGNGTQSIRLPVHPAAPPG